MHWTHLPFSLSSLSHMHFESFLKSRFDFALSVSTMRFWRCQSLQLIFSRRWPCSRWPATFAQVLVRASESLRLLNATKDLFPWQTGELRMIVYVGT